MPYMLILALCHTIIVEEKDGIINYNASSPDELALTNAARHFGIVFKERDDQNNMIVENTFTGENFSFELLNVIEFTSNRKRMSVIVKDNQDGKIYVMTKGADSIIIPRLLKGQEKSIQESEKYLLEFANEGLRTLLLA
jgi:phospholipid-translocating ATPase